jgi:hypothetical protein
LWHNPTPEYSYHLPFLPQSGFLIRVNKLDISAALRTRQFPVWPGLFDFELFTPTREALLRGFGFGFFDKTMLNPFLDFIANRFFFAPIQPA